MGDCRDHLVVMTHDHLLQHLRRLAAQFRDSGATAVFVYGSRARGDAREDSDVDLFIEYSPEAKVPNLFKLVELELTLSRDLGVPVSITTRSSLHPEMRGSIEREAIRVI